MFLGMVTLFLLLLVLFLAVMGYARRGLHVGILFFITGFSFLVVLINLAGDNPENPIYGFVYLLSLVLLGLLLLLPTALVLTFFYSAFLVLRREGITVRNMLSLGGGILTLAYLFVFPVIGRQLPAQSIWNVVYVYLGSLISYLILVSGLFTVSSFLNFIHVLPTRLDYIIVLGAGLNGENVTPLLASRIRRGIALYRKHPGSKLIMSGGQGADEVVAEAEAMYRYALTQSVPATDILREDQSRNTNENLRFSAKLIGDGTAKIAVVTNYYHLFRALLIARKEKIACIGYGARTKFYFSVNAFIREFVGYLVLTKKWHLILLSLWTLLFVFLVATFLAVDLGIL